MYIRMGVGMGVGLGVGIGHGDRVVATHRQDSVAARHQQEILQQAGWYVCVARGQGCA